jgi:hypothetical protein
VQIRAVVNRERWQPNRGKLKNNAFYRLFIYKKQQIADNF